MDFDSVNRICIVSSNPDSEKLRKWSSYLNAPINPEDVQHYRFQLLFECDHFTLKDFEGRRLSINFDENHLDYKRLRHRGKNELIAKALGAAKGYRKVLDLSVGLAVDSVFLCQLGFEVQGVERSPALYTLLSEAFSNTQQKPLQDYVLHHLDSLNFLKVKRGLLDFDAIYFDPMYPHKKKSALPKQEMIIFRDLVGNDSDARDVLREAIAWPVKRIVVKRPLNAEELLPGVTHAYEGKVVRYDTYVLR